MALAQEGGRRSTEGSGGAEKQKEKSGDVAYSFCSVEKRSDIHLLFHERHPPII